MSIYLQNRSRVTNVENKLMVTGGDNDIMTRRDTLGDGD